MKIRIRFDMNDNDDFNLYLRVKTGLNRLINWLNQRFYKDDLSLEETEDGIIIIGNEKYEDVVWNVIGMAMNGAYEMV